MSITWVVVITVHCREWSCMKYKNLCRHRVWISVFDLLQEVEEPRISLAFHFPSISMSCGALTCNGCVEWDSGMLKNNSQNLQKMTRVYRSLYQKLLSSCMFIQISTSLFTWLNEGSVFLNKWQKCNYDIIIARSLSFTNVSMTYSCLKTKTRKVMATDL